MTQHRTKDGAPYRGRSVAGEKLARDTKTPADRAALEKEIRDAYRVAGHGNSTRGKKR